MNELESWSDVIGYEGLYQISNFGNVRSLPHTITVEQKRYKQPRQMHWQGKPLRQHPDGKGYLIVRPCKLGKSKTLLVHRLVALHFIPNPDNKPAVNHLDSNVFNNHASNLEWCTIAENNHHALTVGKRKPINIT